MAGREVIHRIASRVRRELIAQKHAGEKVCEVQREWERVRGSWAACIARLLWSGNRDRRPDWLPFHHIGYTMSYQTRTWSLMSPQGSDDARVAPLPDRDEHPDDETAHTMTAFVESCVETATGSALAAEQRLRHRPRVHKLLRVLHAKKNILVTTHEHPDPDALASSLALSKLLAARLKDARITLSVKGLLHKGLNSAFAQHTQMQLAPWDEQDLRSFDAIVLLDVQPAFRFSPLPPEIAPTAVIDHHRSRGRKPGCPFWDVRIDVGASSSIVFSYFMELEEPIPPDLAATLLFAIETDLAGAAGQPGELDNIALSSLTLLADMRKVYKMRYVDLPQGYFAAYHAALSSAMYYDDVLIAHLSSIVSPETPAVIADFLLRFDQVQTVLVTAADDRSLVLSLRTSGTRRPASELMRHLLRHIGEGGGHKTKAGGVVQMASSSAAELERTRATLRRRLLRCLNVHVAQGKRLIQLQG
jgi:nanoRNase/pAp phosphatase (c-di-AMP/oligoRNAs hydrolase)